MAVFLPQARAEMPRNAMLNFEPINNAIDTNRRNAMLDRQFTADQEHRQSQLGIQREQLDMQRQRFSTEQQNEIKKRFGALAQVVDAEADPAKRAQMWQRITSMHPNAKGLDQSFLDPVQGPKLLMAEAGVYVDPLERDKTRAQLGLIQAQTDQARAHSDLYKRQAMQPTKEEAEAAEAARTKAQTARNIEAGIGQLADVPVAYGGDSGTFGSAVGQFRGDENAYILGPLGRAWGSVTSLAGNTKGSPSEVRALIRGHATALAATLKPLIRKPGEGAWSDRDQALLDSVVGDLTTANNEAEYKRRLEAVRERVMANFGIELAPIQWGGGRNSPAAPASGSNNVRNMSDDELLGILGAP